MCSLYAPLICLTYHSSLLHVWAVVILVHCDTQIGKIQTVYSFIVGPVSAIALPSTARMRML